MANIESPIMIMSEEDIRRALLRISSEIIEKNRGTDDLYVVGIIRRGDILARRIVKILKEFEKKDVPVGSIDTSHYRDDFFPEEEHDLKELINRTEIYLHNESKPLRNKHVILVDDVIQKGRTARAAMDGLMDFGRAASIQLAVLIDRGHRELPIEPNYIGKKVPTSKQERIQVQLTELDGKDSVFITKPAI